MSAPDAVELIPEQMLLVMEMAGYRYVSGTASYWPALRVVAGRTEKQLQDRGSDRRKGDLHTNDTPFPTTEEVEIRALFEVFLKARAQMHGPDLSTI